MAGVGDTGNGATITFSVTTAAYAIQYIRTSPEQVEMLDAGTLADVEYMCELISDLKKAPELTMGVLFNTLLGKPTVPGPNETATITWPQRTGEATAATLVGTGNFRSFAFPNLENGVVQVSELIFKYDGATGPTYTPAT